MTEQIPQQARKTKRYFMLLTIGIFTTIIAQCFKVHNPDAYTLGGLLVEILSQPISYFVILSIVALIVAAIRRNIRMFWFPTLAWLFLIAGIFDIVVGGFNEFVLRPQINQRIEELFRETLKKAEAGDVDAQLDLGGMYQDGEGVALDYSEAVRWYTKAATGDAMIYLSLMKAEGIKEADGWYPKVAEQRAARGYVNDQFSLGRMYYDGRDVPQNYTEAFKWFTKAAEQGHAKAQCNLGGMYYFGREVPQDYKEAAKWYTKAAEQGDADAQLNLGYMCAHGKGVPEDYVQAYKWYNLAAAQGNETAVKNRDILSQEMSTAQIAEAQRLSREFVPRKEHVAGN